MVVALLAYLPHYSYSNEVYGQTTNAAANGLNWVMPSILPEQAGLRVSDVIYRYTTVKDRSDDMVVSVQNENAVAPGYVFRSIDDWSGLPGNKINKVIPVDLIPIELWGNGSIEIEGKGQVVDPFVIYNYRYDPCYDPQADPSCPGYIPEYLPEPVNPLDLIDDPLEDELIQAELEKETEKGDEEEDEEDSQRMQALLLEMERLENLLGGVNAQLESAQAALILQELINMSALPVSYSKQLRGGTYEDTLQYDTRRVPSNLKARRVGLAQELLHQEMVNSQYR